jgi:DNA polymerase
MNETKDIFELVKLYFIQQKEIFGNELIIGKSDSENYHDNIGIKNETVRGEMKKTIEKTTPKKVVSSEINLFAEETKVIPQETATEYSNLEEMYHAIKDCQKCALGKTRKKFVFGVGNPKAKLVLIGEAPGADEDEQGEPFVGRAGQLLNKILEAVNLRREEVYICNILKCRPPNNRDPLPEEEAMCKPYLMQQLELIRPKLILCLGRVAAHALLGTKESMSGLRGKFHEWNGMKVMVTYHPAALLRNPQWKRPTWEDIQLLKKVYDELK